MRAPSENAELVSVNDVVVGISSSPFLEVVSCDRPQAAKSKEPDKITKNMKCLIRAGIAIHRFRIGPSPGIWQLWTIPAEKSNRF
jgi:hypothetical protein